MNGEKLSQIGQNLGAGIGGLGTGIGTAAGGLFSGILGPIFGKTTNVVTTPTPEAEKSRTTIAIFGAVILVVLAVSAFFILSPKAS